MKIRWKILIILLSFALLPLMILRTFSMGSLKDLGANLQTHSRSMLLARATDNLARMAAGTASNISLQGNLYHTTLNAVQHETEFRLNNEISKKISDNAFIVSYEGVEGRPNLVTDPNYKTNAEIYPKKRNRHYVPVKNSGVIDLPIAPEQMSFWLAGNLSIEDAMPYIRRLEPVQALLQEGSSTLGELSLWQEIILENGLVASFPGHASFSRRYDPRGRFWYKETKSEQKPTWSVPEPDPATGSLCYRLSAPLTGTDGKFIGVASIVIPVGTAIKEALTAPPGINTDIMMVSSSLGEESHTPILVLVGQTNSTAGNKGQLHQKGHFWLTPPEPLQLKEDNPRFKKLFQDVTEGKSGVIMMDYKEIPSLWTYSPVKKSLSLLIITPVTEYTAEADEAEQYVKESVTAQFENTSLIAVVVTLGTALFAILVSQGLSRPIRKISEAVIEVGKGNWEARADFSSSDELGELAMTFNEMVPHLREHSSVQQALSLADETQKNLFPESAPRANGLDIGAKCVFSEKTGGDYYDFIRHSDETRDTIIASVGDICGHGISAALQMTSARAYMRALMKQPLQLEEIVRELNSLIAEDSIKTGHFMTMFIMSCDIQSQSISWIRAGHDPALLYTPKKNSFDELIGMGLALGVDETYSYQKQITAIDPGQILILYTDGIWEASNHAGQQFSKDRLMEIVRDRQDAEAQTIADKIINEVRKFRNEEPLEDDCTVIVFKFL